MHDMKAWVDQALLLILYFNVLTGTLTLLIIYIKSGEAGCHGFCPSLRNHSVQGPFFTSVTLRDLYFHRLSKWEALQNNCHLRQGENCITGWTRQTLGVNIRWRLIKTYHSVREANFTKCYKTPYIWTAEISSRIIWNSQVTYIKGSNNSVKYPT